MQMYVLCLINISCFGVKTFQGLPSISFRLHCTLLLFTDLILCTHRELLPHCKLAPTGLNLGTKQCPILPPSSLQAPALFHSGPHLHQKEVLIVVKPWWEGVGVACIPLGCGLAGQSVFQVVLGISLRSFGAQPLSSHPSFLFDPHPHPSW